jgi:Tfp pilus assembly protein PilF
MNRKAAQILTVALGVGLIGFILWMPRKSGPENVAAENAVVEELPSTSDPVELAVEKVSGPNPMEGILALRELTEQDEPNVDAVVWLGIFGVQSGQLDKARERFSEALSIDPSHSEATWQLALLDMEAGAYDRAVVGFETVMEQDSSYANGLFFTARCYEAMGKPEAARIRYQEYLPYAPDTVIEQRVLDFINRLDSGESAGINE